ncbi:hypothetical protein BGZ57DRAFT_860424 [Hyaloscypha finlandica]|nr:hypothetical protein BGZ57DRAFT_860424 [Hyaloscypha finlandica]
MTTPVPERILASRENQGLVNLQRLVDRIANRMPRNASVPIVLVSGFSGWSEALFGTFNYWGGFEDLPAVLHAAGYTVIVLTSATFDVPSAFSPNTIPIDYGAVYPARYGYARYSNCSRAVLYGSLPTDWKWDTESPVHCICHSQGGNTIRLLIELLRGNYGNIHSIYFTTADNRQNMIKSIVTLGTPHKDTTITAAVQTSSPNLLYRYRSERPGSMTYNSTIGGFLGFQTNRSVALWWEGLRNPLFPPHNGFYDNGIPGVNALNEFAPAPTPNTFYFTMSFDASEDFPNVRLSVADFATFPSPLNLLNIPGTLAAISLNVFISYVPGAPTLVNLAKWAVQVANTHLGALGFELPAQSARLIPGISSAEFQPNDGIVNTVSMRGPNDAQVSNEADFPIQSLGSHSLATAAKGTYWHLGINKTMDHGDEIGVFTVGETLTKYLPAKYEEVKQMYLEFAELLARLPPPKQDLSLDFLLRLKLDLKLDLMKSTSTTYFLANLQALDALITLLDSLPARGLAINDTWATVRYFNKHHCIFGRLWGRQTSPMSCFNQQFPLVFGRS